MTDAPPLHEALGPVAGLVGTWRGRGEGHYPTIEDFAYLEEVTFGHVGKPFLAYHQRTRHADTGQPLHTEAGYLRLPDGAPELVMAQPTGITEVYTGTWGDGVLDLRCDTPGRTPSARPVHALRRRFTLDGDTLSYDLWMAHDDTPETHHLHATLHRQEAP